MSFLVHMTAELAIDLSETVSRQMPADVSAEGQGSAAILIDQLRQALGRTLSKGGVIELAEFIAVLNSVQSAAGADRLLVARSYSPGLIG